MIDFISAGNKAETKTEEVHSGWLEVSGQVKSFKPGSCFPVESRFDRLGERRTCPMTSMDRMCGMAMDGEQMCCMVTCRMRDSRTWDAARHVEKSCCCM